MTSIRWPTNDESPWGVDPAKARRERIAVAALQSVIEISTDCTAEDIAVDAVALADALIAELDKKP